MVETDIRSIRYLQDVLSYKGLAPEVVVGVVLREAVETQKLRPRPRLESAIERDWRAIAETALNTALRDVAQAIFNVERADRLALISHMLRPPIMRVGPIEVLDFPATEMLVGLLGPARSVRCSFAASAMPALWIAHTSAATSSETQVRFEDRDPWLCDIVRMAAVVIDADMEVVCRNPFLRRNEARWEAELVMPPFGADIRDREALPRRVLDRISALEKGRLQHEPVAIADALVSGGDARFVLLLSAGALFRVVGVEAVAREEMVDSGRLAAVYDVPPGMIYSTTQIATSVLVLEPTAKEQRRVRFIDLANERFARSSGRGGRLEILPEVPWADALIGSIDDAAGWGRDVELEEVRSQNGILTVDRYLQSASGAALSSFLEAYEARPLNDLVEIIRPRALPKSDNGDHIVLEASPGDIDETGFLQVPQRQARLTQGALRNARNQQVKSGDVLLSIKGTIGRVGLVSDGAPAAGMDEFWTAGQSLVILRSKGMIAPEVLYEYLSNDVVQEHINSLAGGAVIQSINAKDLSAFSVPLPDREEQKRIVEAFVTRQRYYDIILQTRETISAQKRSSWPHSELVVQSA